MNNKLTAALILLLILTQGYINYRLVESQERVAKDIMTANIVIAIASQRGGIGLIETLLEEPQKENGFSLSGIDGNTRFMPVQNTQTR